MSRSTKTLFLALAAMSPLFAQSPFVGRWDFNLTVPDGPSRGSTWLGITEKNGALDVWYQPTGGNMYQLKDVKASGSHLTLAISPANAKGAATVWELDAAGNALNGEQKRGDKAFAIHGVRSPELKRNPPKAWTAPEPLFNGKDLTGWEPFGNVTNNHWTVKDGVMFNAEHGANLKTTRTFTDFKVHYEVNCPEDGNSGFYLRGRYELQIEDEPLSKNPPERRIGSVYGRITPMPALPRTPGVWQTFDVTLVGRIVTEVHNGVTVIDHKEIEGITGGALDANEGDPGPFYIQGDHTGGLSFRNITVSVPKN